MLALGRATVVLVMAGLLLSCSSPKAEQASPEACYLYVLHYIADGDRSAVKENIKRLEKELRSSVPDVCEGQNPELYVGMAAYGYSAGEACGRSC